MKIPLFLRFALIATLSTSFACADVQLPAIISNHMVLEKAARVPIWGKASPGEEVTVTLGGQIAKAKADANGKWMTALNLKDSAPGPFEMTVEGKNKLTLTDVIVGEVWIASGQSNMNFAVKHALDADPVIAQSANPQIRQFYVKKQPMVEPQGDTQGNWVAASPATTGDFSAVGYYFAKKLQTELNVPVGFVHSSWDGTPSEAWTSVEAIDSVPDLKAASDPLRAALEGYPDKRKAFIDGMSAWNKENGREDKTVANPAAFTGKDVSTDGWIPVKIPGVVTAPGIPKTGAVWLRKEIFIPTGTNPNLLLYLPMNGYESLYWNGKLIKQITARDFPDPGYLLYKLPLGEVNAGKNILAIRLYEPVTPAKFIGEPKASLTFPDTSKAVWISLAGEWPAKAEYAFPDLDARKVAAAPQPPANPPAAEQVAACLFNGMINPIVPYAISGVIWYQGETNAERAYQYRTAFPLLITDWRKQWNQGNFPFYFCQLANFMAKKPEPGESAWAELREAQSMALKVPNTGQAVLIDIGEAGDIHPRDKKDAGERLALIALAGTYGKSIPCSGPVYDSMKIENGRIILSFKHADGGLAARPLPASYVVSSKANQTAPLMHNSPGSQLEGFAICGEDKKWVWADARIDGGKVIVWSDRVPAPVAVRYAWADNPTCNLYNGAGLPASPFRTDNFTPITLNAKY